jgi:hypothetical protein
MSSRRSSQTDDAHADQGVSPVRVRQGVISGRVLTVLLTSLSLGVVALGVAYLAVVHWSL